MRLWVRLTYLSDLWVRLIFGQMYSPIGEVWVRLTFLSDLWVRLIFGQMYSPIGEALGQVDIFVILGSG